MEHLEDVVSMLDIHSIPPEELKKQLRYLGDSEVEKTLSVLELTNSQEAEGNQSVSCNGGPRGLLIYRQQPSLASMVASDHSIGFCCNPLSN